MQLLLLIAGLILLLAGGGWFAAAGTVGWILVIVAVALTAIQIAVFAAASRRIRRTDWRI